MRRWLALAILAVAAGCEPEVERDYNTGAGTPAGSNPTGTATGNTGDTWDCDNLCEEADTNTQWQCLLSAVIDDGYDIWTVEDCPSWTNTEITEQECLTCASQIGLADDDCRRYRDACGL